MKSREWMDFKLTFHLGLSRNPNVCSEIIQIDCLLNLHYITAFQPCGNNDRLTLGSEPSVGRPTNLKMLSCLRSRNKGGQKSICISLHLCYTCTFVWYKIKDCVLLISVWKQLGCSRSWSWMLGVILVYDRRAVLTAADKAKVEGEQH